MDDHRIVELYWERSEAAIKETQKKYGKYCRYIARNILRSEPDAEECENDTYLHAWRAMPPHKPSVLSTFLGKITRRISIDRVRKHQAAKRGGGEMPLALEELEDCIAGNGDVEKEYDRQALIHLINGFLGELPDTERRVFLRRYWYMDPISAIARRFGFTQSKVTSMLHRTRGKLRAQLREEGY